MNPSPDLPSWLRRFHAKERFHVHRHLFGAEPSPGFLSELAVLLDRPLDPPAFFATDYHLDWLYAALHCAQHGPACPVANEESLVRGDQQDIDALLACPSRHGIDLVLIEAKGVTSWSNGQMGKKIARLRALFGHDGRRWPGVRPHLVLLSPRPPQKLDTHGWPAWATRGGAPASLRLPVPDDLLRVERCDAAGRAHAHGTSWQILPRGSR